MARETRDARRRRFEEKTLEETTWSRERFAFQPINEEVGEAIFSPTSFLSTPCRKRKLRLERLFKIISEVTSDFEQENVIKRRVPNFKKFKDSPFIRLLFHIFISRRTTESHLASP